MKRVELFLLIAMLAIFSSATYAINDVTCRVARSNQSFPARITDATIVVEPYGAYTKHSLYLTYTPTGISSSQYNNTEIIHKFNLPKNAVVTDLWLWIGNNIMQGRIMETWTARRIFDSLQVVRIDPCFLFKNNDQYEMRVYPVNDGTGVRPTQRKIKITYIVPSFWKQTESYTELPINMFVPGTSTTVYLNILYKASANVGLPKIYEDPNANFSFIADTNGGSYYSYLYSNMFSIPNPVTLKYQNSFVGGYLSKSKEKVGLNDLFQVTIMPNKLFSPGEGSGSKGKKFAIALDMTGFFNGDRQKLLIQLKEFLLNTLTSDDKFNILLNKKGITHQVNESFLEASSDNILNTIEKIKTSDWMSIAIHKFRIDYADPKAPQAWSFNTINSVAYVQNQPSLYYTLHSNPTPIIASYNHVFSAVPSDLEAATIIDSLKKFFDRGGRFISYFNLDANSTEKIVKYFIPSLKTVTRNTANSTLYRNPNGNTGMLFQEYFDHSGNNFLSFDDPDVKVEVANSKGEPTIVSKKIGNGLLIATGVWLFNDVESTRRVVAPALLGLNRYNSSYKPFSDFVKSVNNTAKDSSCTDVLVFTNFDFIDTQDSTQQFVTNNLDGLSSGVRYHTVNLVTDSLVQMPRITDNGTVYLGSGYLQSLISKKTGGQHFEIANTSWQTISLALKSDATYTVKEINVSAKGDNETWKITELVKIDNTIPGAPITYIGKSTSATEVTFNVDMKFNGIDSTFSASFKFPVEKETVSEVKPLNAILGSHYINRAYNEVPRDTAKIMNLAITHRVVSDFSALLALEPNDTIKYMNPKPFDESVLDNEDFEVIVDSLSFSAYPNPFNATTNFSVTVKEPSLVTLTIYNTVGEEVATLASDAYVSSQQRFAWDSNSKGYLASGIYIARISIKGSLSGDVATKSIKLVLLK